MKGLLRILKMLPAKVKFVGVLAVVAALIITLGLRLGLDRKFVFALVVGVVVLALLIWGINALVELRDKRRGRAFESGLGAEGDKVVVAKEEAREALRELSEQWKGAVGRLREAGLSIYDLPWYLMIGEPASGKTTTLKESGLDFPVGTESLSGPGGTRNCDWWFTNEAVILDTAGRFTFQVDTAPDRVEWDAFLGFLRRHRRSCPINGVVLVIPATSLLEDSIDAQEEKAKNIRRKLLHLQKVLEIRFPIYVLITKADRILGFTEYFGRLKPAEQRRMFGWSSPDGADKPWDEAEFTTAFREIVERIHRLRLRLLSEETRTAETDQFFIFPEELAELERPLATYLNAIFALSRFDEPFIYRGFFLTSGLQEGRPIARACRELLQDQMGSTEGVIEDLEAVFKKSRAFFIRDFYEKKLFPEQGLIARTRAALKRDRINRWILRGATIAFVAAAIPLLVLAHRHLGEDLGELVPVVRRAKACLAAGEQCGFQEAYTRLAAVEAARLNLVEAPLWLRWSLLRGQRTNEVTAELLPRVEAALLREKILPPLLLSAERRAGRRLWEPDEALTRFEDYELFRGTLEEVLALHESAGPAGRGDLSIDKIVEFVAATAGRDQSPAGEEIDAALAIGAVGADPEAFKLGSVFRVAQGYLWQQGRPLRVATRPFTDAFVDWWRIENVGHWYEDLRRSLDGYRAAYEDLLDLDGASHLNAADLLSDYSAGAARLAGIWQTGRIHMRREQEADLGDELLASASEALEGASGGALAVPEWQKWKKDCDTDWAALARLSEDVGGARNPCARIPPDWQRLSEEIGRHDYLFELEPSQQPYGRGTYRWAEATDLLSEPIRNLGELAGPEGRREATESLRQRLMENSARRDSVVEQVHIDTIQAYRQTELDNLLGAGSPVADLLALRETADVPVQLRAERAHRQGERVAAAALAVRVLEPTYWFFQDRLREASTDPGIGAIELYAQPANEHLAWIIEQGGYAVEYGDVRDWIAAVNEAELEYVDALIGGAKCGDVSGQTLDCPTRAQSAGSWAEFAFEIQSWKPIRQVTGSGGAGVKVDEVLKELDAVAWSDPQIAQRVSSLAGRCTGGAVSERVQQAATQLQTCVASLGTDVQQASALVAQGACGGERRALRFFSGLGSGSVDCLQRAESNGRRLLRQGAGGAVVARAEELLGTVPWGRYPFVVGSRLQAGIRRSADGLTLPTADLASVNATLASFADLDRFLGASGPAGAQLGQAQRGKLATLKAWQALFASPVHGTKVTLRVKPAGPRWLSFGPLGDVKRFYEQGDSKEFRIVDDAPFVLEARGRYRPSEPLWTSQLELSGGPLKILYFIQALGRKADDRGSAWDVSIRLPAPDLPGPTGPPDLQATFRFELPRPLPGAFPD
jgi:hypothetical protein